jgi:hypothetical protein
MISSTCDFDRHIGMLPSSCYSCDFDRDICMLSSSCEFDRHILLSSSCELDRHILISSSCEFMLPIWTPNEDFGSTNKPPGKALFNVSYPKSSTHDPEKVIRKHVPYGLFGLPKSSFGSHGVRHAMGVHLVSSTESDRRIIMISSSCEFGILSSS